MRNLPRNLFFHFLDLRPPFWPNEVTSRSLLAEVTSRKLGQVRALAVKPAASVLHGKMTRYYCLESGD